MQALQVGNDIVAETAQRLLKLQEAINRQTLLIASTLAGQQGERDSNRAEVEQYKKDIAEFNRQLTDTPQKSY